MRTTGLGHEALDHAMESDAIIEFFVGEFLDVLDMGGCGLEGEHVTGLGHFDILSGCRRPPIADARLPVNHRRPRRALRVKVLAVGSWRKKWVICHCGPCRKAKG
jgi:hypothetical protein